MKFKDYFSLKHIVFAVLLFAILIPIALRDSNTQVKVTFGDESFSIRSDRYSMSMNYTDIESVELAPLAEPGERLEDCFDDDIIRYGKWLNDAWGEYYITADLDTSNCVVIQLIDGRTFVFSSKDNDQTATLCDQLLAKLPTP